MKTISIIFLLFFSFGTFGQSAKKMNKKLRADFALEEQKQDSTLAVFLKRRFEFDSLKLIANSKIVLLSDKESFARNPYLKIYELTRQLEQLGINPNTLIPADSGVKGLPDYRRSFVPIREIIRTDVKFEKVSSRLYLDMFKIKEQNSMLSGKLNEYELHTKSNREKQEELEIYNEQLKAFLPRVDSLITVYEKLIVQLNSQEQILKNKLGELEENYRLKGPKGFPEGYRKVFPNIHPLPGDVEVAVTRDTDEGPFASEIVPKVVEVPEQNPEVYKVVDEPAEFPGGMSALKNYLDTHLNYPPVAKQMGISGKVYLQFVVSDKGVISDIKIKKGVTDCPECDMEAKRLVRTMPNWIPGKMSGKPVNSYFILPIIFKLN